MKKKALFILPLVALLGVLAFNVKPMNYSVALAEENTSEVVASEETSSSNIVDGVIGQGETIIANTRNAAEDLLYTYVIPLFSGVSLTSLIAMAVSITLAVVNKKSNGKIRKKMLDVVNTASNIILQAKNMREMAEKQYKETKELAKNVIEQVNELIDSGKLIEEDIKKMLGIKDIMVALLEIEAKQLANDGNAVASGLAEDVNKLVVDTKNLIR